MPHPTASGVPSDWRPSPGEEGQVWLDGQGRRVNADGRLLCRAKRRKGGGALCQSPLLVRDGLCRIHGGKTPAVRPDLWRDGRPPKKLIGLLSQPTAELVALANDAEELLSLRSELTYLHSRLSELCQQSQSLPTADDWAAALAAFETGNHQELGTILRKGRDGWETLSRTLTLMESVRRLTETEVKRETAKTQSMSVAAAMAFARALIDAVTSEVPDTATQSRVVQRTLQAVHAIPSLMGLSHAPPPPVPIDAVVLDQPS